jgi:ATP-binding cassette subfamily B protein
LILVLDGGRVAERGTHAQLLAAGGLYASLYREQLAAETLAEDAA